MEKSVIKISDVKAETLIGSVFNDLFKIIYQTEQYKNRIIEWDFNDVSFLHPFFLLPLSLYRQTKNDIQLAGINDYLRLISFASPYYVGENTDLENYLKDLPSKSEIALQKP